MLAIILLLCAIGQYSPAFGGFLRSSSSAVGIPLSVPVDIPISAPGSVVVQANGALPVYSASSAHPYSVALTYAVAQPSTTVLKYASPYAATNPVVKYSLGAPVTTTITTYSGFTAPSPQFFNRFPSSLQNLPVQSSPSFRFHTSPLPTGFYVAPPQLTYANPSAW